MRSSKVIPYTIILLGLLGCTKEPALKVYSLDMPQVGIVQSSPYKNKNIKVSYPYSAREEISEKMNFAYGNGNSGSYQNSEWSNNMSKLLQGTFIEVLDNSRLFNAVLLDTSTAKENYRLESTIFAFHHSVLHSAQGTKSYAIVSIQFSLISIETGHLVKSKRFSYREVTPAIDAQGYVKATNIAIDRLGRDLVQWLR